MPWIRQLKSLYKGILLKVKSGEGHSDYLLFTPTKVGELTLTVTAGAMSADLFGGVDIKDRLQKTLTVKVLVNLFYK